MNDPSRRSPPPASRVTSRVALTLALASLATAPLAAACGADATPAAGGGDSGGYRAALAHTLLVGTNDNAEVVKVIEGTKDALLVSSKARKVTRLRVVDGALQVVRDRALFEADTSESELTHVDVSSDGSWAVLTRTIITTDDAGAQTACLGELVFVDATDTDSFGEILAQLPVGSMPDSVDISDDDLLVAVANERDGPDAWGKCEVTTATPSISIVDVSAGPRQPVERHRIQMIDADTGPREPESIIFGADNDLVVSTLQDSHEVVTFRVSALAGLDAPTSADVTITALPPNSLGAKPWPDGVGRFTDGDGAEHFAIAGEWNDTLTILDGDGTVVTSVEFQEADFPPNMPRVVASGSPLFSPDSVAPFHAGGRSYVALSLRQAGAALFYDVTDAAHPTFAQVVAVGKDEQGGIDEHGSTIRPEGISAAADGSFVVVANEGESSVSLLLPE